MTSIHSGLLDTLNAPKWENVTTAEQSGTGRCANTNPLLDRINLDREGSGPDGNNARG